MFLLASAYLKIDPEDCLVVEDTVAGIEAAIAAGMEQAAVGDAIYSNMATYNLRSFSELLNI